MLGDFGVLIYGGMEKKKALAYNFLSQLTSVLGGLIGFLAASVQGFHVLLLPFAAGGFIYIAASDLIPELHKETNPKKSVSAFAIFLLGITFMLAVKLVFGA